MLDELSEVVKGGARGFGSLASKNWRRKTRASERVSGRFGSFGPARLDVNRCSQNPLVVKAMGVKPKFAILAT